MSSPRPGPKPKLTEDDVRAIRASDHSYRTLGRFYNVSYQMIYYIKKGKKYGWVV